MLALSARVDLIVNFETFGLPLVGVSLQSRIRARLRADTPKRVTPFSSRGSYIDPFRNWWRASCPSLTVGDGTVILHESAERIDARPENPGSNHSSPSMARRTSGLGWTKKGVAYPPRTSNRPAGTRLGSLSQSGGEAGKVLVLVLRRSHTHARRYPGSFDLRAHSRVMETPT